MQATSSKRISRSVRSSARAIARSNPVPSLGTSAGARLTVTRRAGNSKPALRTAARTRSRASWMARSVSPTMVKLGSPLATSTSTVTGTPASPWTAQLMAVATIRSSIATPISVVSGWLTHGH